MPLSSSSEGAGGPDISRRRQPIRQALTRGHAQVDDLLARAPEPVRQRVVRKGQVVPEGWELLDWQFEGAGDVPKRCRAGRQEHGERVPFQVEQESMALSQGQIANLRPY